MGHFDHRMELWSQDVPEAGPGEGESLEGGKVGNLTHMDFLLGGSLSCRHLKTTSVNF